MKKPKLKTNKITSQLTFHKLDWLEYTAIGIGLWFIIYPKPYIFLFAVLLVMPVVGLILNGFQKPSIASLVEITKDKNKGKRYDVADFIDLPAWIIGLRVLLDFEFESYFSVLIPGTIAFIVMLVILFSTHKLIQQSTKSKFWIYSSLVFNIWLYSFAVTYGINCVYDYSDPEVYDAGVIGKRVSHGRKHTSYYVQVTPWGHHYDSEEIKVSRDQYDELQEGDAIKIDRKQGLLNIPWYYIERGYTRAGTRIDPPPQMP